MGDGTADGTVGGGDEDMFGRLRRDDSGAATLEFSGMVAAAAVLALSVLIASVPGGTSLGDRFMYAVCQVTTFGQGGCQQSTTADEHIPPQPCVLSSNSTSMDREIAVVVVTASDGRKFEVAQLSDGTYRVTALTSDGAGLSTGVGGGISLTVSDTTVGGTASADVGVSLDLQSGEVYYTDDPEEVERMVSEEAEDALEDDLVGGGPVRDVWEWGQDRVGDVTGNGDYDFPDPDETFTQGGVSLNASAEATAITDSAGAEVGATTALGVREGHRTGNTTVYLSSKVEGEVGLQELGVDTSGPEFQGANLSGSLEIVTAVTVDSEGNMVSVQVTGTAAGENKGAATALFGGSGDSSLSNSSSSATVFQSTLPIRNDIDRGVASRFLLAQGVSQLGGVALQAGTLPASVLATTQFLQAAQDRGYTTQQTYDTDNETVFGVDASGKLVVQLGVSAEVQTSSLQSTGAEYWDGSQWVEWEACTA